MRASGPRSSRHRPHPNAAHALHALPAARRRRRRLLRLRAAQGRFYRGNGEPRRLPWRSPTAASSPRTSSMCLDAADTSKLAAFFGLGNSLSLAVAGRAPTTPWRRRSAKKSCWDARLRRFMRARSTRLRRPRGRDHLGAASDSAGCASTSARPRTASRRAAVPHEKTRRARWADFDTAAGRRPAPGLAGLLRWPLPGWRKGPGCGVCRVCAGGRGGAAAGRPRAGLRAAVSVFAGKDTWSCCGRG